MKPLFARIASRTGRRVWPVLLVVLGVVGGGCEARESAAVADLWTTLPGWPAHEAEAIRVVGVVESTDAARDLWVIRDAQGAEWAPLELPPPFRVEGAQVVTDVRRRPDLLSIGMTATLVEILRIRHGTGRTRP